MDTSGFFQYPGTDQQVPTDTPPGFLEDRGEDDWALCSSTPRRGCTASASPS